MRGGTTYYRCSHSHLRCPASIKVLDSGKVIANGKRHSHLKSKKTRGNIHLFISTNKQINIILLGRKLFIGNHQFYIHSRKNNKIYWRCVKYSCSTRVHTNENGEIIRSPRPDHYH